MKNFDYSFSAYHKNASLGISEALNKFNSGAKTPIIICIGSDLVLGDSLGPLVGTMLKKRNISSYIYGTLNYPITAKEIEYAKTHLKTMHPNTVAIAIDAAVGLKEDIGIIKVVNEGLKPGIGVNKNLGQIGDIGIIGVVSAKTGKNFDLFNLTRLNLVYKMAEQIADGIANYINTCIEPNFKSATLLQGSMAQQKLYGA